MTRLCFIILIVTINSAITSKIVDPDELRNTTELIRSKGYTCEEHDVITDDGYILSIQRIPYGKKKNNRLNRPVVLLQHGLLDASSTWVFDSPEQSLGYLLADSGYDVWLGNMRGNTYGLRHKSLNPKQDEFWAFSWDEMAAHDLPSMINYILKVANQTNLFYIGHSQGTLIGFSEFGRNHELASKVKLFVALGPVATVGYIESPIKHLTGPTPQIDDLYTTLFGKRDFLPNSQFIKWLSDKACNIHAPEHVLCENILFVLCGPSKYLNISRIPVYTAHDPAGTSVQNMLHFTQMVYSKKFQMYDYGSDKLNLLHYNQTKPPEYDLNQVKLPVALLWSQNDWLADPDDVQFLRQKLPNIVYDQYINNWDHLDFIWATNAPQTIYFNIIQLMSKYL